jgi:putative ABC transport system ATP-binding protein
MDEVILDIKNVCFRWKNSGSLLLNLPEFKIKKHEHVFLQGPSGSGKSTLLGLVGGILVSESGTLKVLGQDIKNFTRSGRDSFRVDHLGFIFQLFNLLPYLSIEENVMLPLSFSSIRAKRAGKTKIDQVNEAHRLLKALALGEQLAEKSPVTELSVGQQQRVAAARALIGNPELIIADEPTSALDADLRHSFLELLFGECKKAGSTLLFVSHDSTLSELFNRKISMDEINNNVN